MTNEPNIFVNVSRKSCGTLDQRCSHKGSMVESEIEFVLVAPPRDEKGKATTAIWQRRRQRRGKGEGRRGVARAQLGRRAREREEKKDQGFRLGET